MAFFDGLVDGLERISEQWATADEAPPHTEQHHAPYPSATSAELVTLVAKLQAKLSRQAKRLADVQADNHRLQQHQTMTENVLVMAPDERTGWKKLISGAFPPIGG